MSVEDISAGKLDDKKPVGVSSSKIEKICRGIVWGGLVGERLAPIIWSHNETKFTQVYSFDPVITPRSRNCRKWCRKVAAYSSSRRPDSLDEIWIGIDRNDVERLKISIVIRFTNFTTESQYCYGYHCDLIGVLIID